jgi:lysylphosphatidylglycerol synthetase-like protein (DUF2156 family)
MLFPPAAVWLLLFLFPRAIDKLERWNPFPAGGALHTLFAAVVLWVPVLLALTSIAWLLMQNPNFLRLPTSVPATRTATCIVISGIALFVTITIGTVVAGYLVYAPTVDSQVQYHIRVWRGGLWLGSAVTPLAATLWAWCSLRRERGEG